MKNNLEYKINQLIQLLISRDLGYGSKLYPNRNHNGTYINGESFDYFVFHKNYKKVFDVKECHSNKWQIKKKDMSQAFNLLRCSDAGVDSFFLIYFYLDKQLIKLDIKKFFNLITVRKYVISSDGIKINVLEEFEL